jgi:hypothetical protein
MRLATFQPLDQDASEIGAVIEGDRIVRFNRARPGMAQDMIDLITRWADLEGEARRLASAAAERSRLSDAASTPDRTARSTWSHTSTLFAGDVRNARPAEPASRRTGVEV